MVNVFFFFLSSPSAFISTNKKYVFKVLTYTFCPCRLIYSNFYAAQIPKYSDSIECLWLLISVSFYTCVHVSQSLSLFNLFDLITMIHIVTTWYPTILRVAYRQPLDFQNVSHYIFDETK